MDRLNLFYVEDEEMPGTGSIQEVREKDGQRYREVIASGVSADDAKMMMASWVMLELLTQAVGHISTVADDDLAEEIKVTIRDLNYLRHRGDGSRSVQVQNRESYLEVFEKNASVDTTGGTMYFDQVDTYEDENGRITVTMQISKNQGMDFKLQNGWVLVKPEAVNNVNEHGIYAGRPTGKTQKWGIVEAVPEEGDPGFGDVKWRPGDRVLVPDTGAKTVTIDGVLFYIIFHGDIIFGFSDYITD